MMPGKLWPLLDTFPLQHTTFIFVLASVRKYPKFQHFRSGKNLSWTDCSPQRGKDFVGGIITDLGVSWAHPKKSTKFFPEQRITRIFQDKSYHKYLWESDILLFNETWNWMNEWSFQQAHTFSSNSEADYLKYWHSFDAMLILYQLKSTESYRIIPNLCWHKQFKNP